MTGLFSLALFFSVITSRAAAPDICPRPNIMLVIKKAAAQFVPPQVWVDPAQYWTVNVREPDTSRVMAAAILPVWSPKPPDV
jgi:hypothetical protein